MSEELANKVGQTYIKLVQKNPKLFGAVYDLGNAYRKLPGRSPVYHINGKMAPYMQKYLAEHLTDVIVCTHLYPAEILTHMRLNGMERRRLCLLRRTTLAFRLRRNRTATCT